MSVISHGTRGNSRVEQTSLSVQSELWSYWCTYTNVCMYSLHSDLIFHAFTRAYIIHIDIEQPVYILRIGHYKSHLH